MSKLKLTIVGIALVFIITGMVGAVSAHGGGPHACDNSHPTGVCPDGMVCGVVGYQHDHDHQTTEVPCTHYHAQVCHHGDYYGDHDHAYNEAGWGHWYEHHGDHCHDAYYEHNHDHQIVEVPCTHTIYGCACPVGMIDCGGVCKNPLTDCQNCGSCGNACPVDQKCVVGVCTDKTCPGDFACGEGMFCVDGSCYDPSDCTNGILDEYTWNYAGYLHNMILDEYNPGTGHVGGRGTFTGGVEPADGTKWVLNGTLYDDTFAFTVVYTEGPRMPYTLTTSGSTVNCALITGPGWTIIRVVPEQQPSSGYFTFTSQAMVDSSGSCESNIPALADIALPILEGQHLNVWVTSTGIIDGARVFYYHDSNEVSFNAACTQKQYFSRCSQDGQSGVGTLVFQMYAPLQRFRVVAAKPYTSTPGGHQINIKIVDPLTTKVLWPLSVADQDLATTHGDEMAYDHTFSLTQDYQLCRVQNFESNGWIFGIPTL